MTAPDPATSRQLLEEAQNVLQSVALEFIVISPRLEVPYTDDPGQSPWSRSSGAQARRAHDLSMTIRRHLGLPYRPRTRAYGQPLTGADIASVADARIAELEQLAREILASFTMTDSGYRARVGQVQIRRWRARLNGAEG